MSSTVDTILGLFSRAFLRKKRATKAEETTILLALFFTIKVSIFRRIAWYCWEMKKVADSYFHISLGSRNTSSVSCSKVAFQKKSCTFEKILLLSNFQYSKLVYSRSKSRRSKTSSALHERSGFNLITLLDFRENKDNFEARTERVNFGLFYLNSDFT